MAAADLVGIGGREIQCAVTAHAHPNDIKTVHVDRITPFDPAIYVHHLLWFPPIVGLRCNHDGINLPTSSQGIDAAIVAYFRKVFPAEAFAMQEHDEGLALRFEVVGQVKPKIVAVLDGVAAGNQLRFQDQRPKANQ